MQFAFLALLLVSSVGQNAQVGSSQLPTAETKKAKKICRTVEADVGSRLRNRKTCKTAEEWASERDSMLETDLRRVSR